MLYQCIVNNFFLTKVLCCATQHLWFCFVKNSCTVIPGGYSHIKKVGCSSEILKRYQDPVLLAFLHRPPPPPEEVPILKQHVISCIFFQFNTLKGTAKPSACDILRLNTFRSTKTAFLTLEGTTLKYPCPFGVGVPPLRL